MLDHIRNYVAENLEDMEKEYTLLNGLFVTVDKFLMLNICKEARPPVSVLKVFKNKWFNQEYFNIIVNSTNLYTLSMDTALRMIVFLNSALVMFSGEIPLEKQKETVRECKFVYDHYDEKIMENVVTTYTFTVLFSSSVIKEKNDFITTVKIKLMFDKFTDTERSIATHDECELNRDEFKAYVKFIEAHFDIKMVENYYADAAKRTIL